MPTITVIHHNDEGAWWGESPDVPGWSAAAGSQPDLVRLAEEGLREFGMNADLRHVLPTKHTPQQGSRMPTIFFDHTASRVIVAGVDPGGQEQVAKALAEHFQAKEQGLVATSGGAPPS